MIPAFTASGALPPYVASATDRNGCSPYKASVSHIHAALAQTREREVLLRGLIDYRSALRAVGIVDGFQLIDGSFTEDCEGLRKRPPQDIDVVTFARLPGPPQDRQTFVQANLPLFTPRVTKATYYCDAYFVDLDKPSHLLVEDTAYWFGLFSHQRTTALWKGLVHLQLTSDDDAVRAMMDARGSW